MDRHGFKAPAVVLLRSNVHTQEVSGKASKRQARDTSLKWNACTQGLQNKSGREGRGRASYYYCYYLRDSLAEKCSNRKLSRFIVIYWIVLNLIKSLLMEYFYIVALVLLFKLRIWMLFPETCLACIHLFLLPAAAWGRGRSDQAGGERKDTSVSAGGETHSCPHTAAAATQQGAAQTQFTQSTHHSHQQHTYTPLQCHLEVIAFMLLSPQINLLMIVIRILHTFLFHSGTVEVEFRERIPSCFWAGCFHRCATQMNRNLLHSWCDLNCLDSFRLSVPPHNIKKLKACISSCRTCHAGCWGRLWWTLLMSAVGLEMVSLFNSFQIVQIFTF